MGTSSVEGFGAAEFLGIMLHPANWSPRGWIERNHKKCGSVSQELLPESAIGAGKSTDRKRIYFWE
jgi:hypothetical protein